MELWEAIVMGLVQGLAEFLPISSSGHLAIFKYILDLDLEASGGLVFDVMLHFGTLVAIFIAFWKDIKKLVTEGFRILGAWLTNAGRFVGNLFRKKKKAYVPVVTSAYRKFVLLVLVSTLPTGAIGVLLQDVIEKASATLLAPGICLLGTAILLTVADYVTEGHKRPNQIGYQEAALVGVAQGLATLPGLSRSGTTIMACLCLGFDRNFAVKYSFIMSIPAVLGACVLELKDFTAEGMDWIVLVNYIVGTAVAAVVGYICIKTMLVVVRGKKFKGFAYYCLVIGAVAVVWNFVN